MDFVPAALRAQGYRLRPETEADTPFLLALYASTREAELAPVPWSAAEKAAFLAQQFAAQRHHYRTYFAGCAFDIIEHRGVPVGRLYVDIRQTHIHVIDIALLPGSRGRGVGTAFMTEVQVFGTARAMGLSLFVEKFNPALQLYRRLGFIDIADHAVHIEMEWLPGFVGRNQLNSA